MDLTHDTSLMAYLRQVPDPRGRRGQSFEWWYLLAVLTAAVAAGAQGVRAMADWAKAREAELVALLRPRCGRVPSLSTLERTLWRIGRAALEEALSQHAEAGGGPVGAALQGVALDGKVQGGVVAHGGSLCLVSLTCHGSGVVLAQVAAAGKAGELAAAPGLVERLDWRQRVLTVDALHCHRDLARSLRAQGGDYLMALKGNEPTAVAAVVELFETPPSRRFQPVEGRCFTREKGHGRVEERLLETSTQLNDYLRAEGWPGVAQVMRRRCRRELLKSGKVTMETTYFITSLSPAQADPAQLARLIRGHWTIENKVHHVRDVSFREDACSARTGSAAQALAALHNGVLNALRFAGCTNIAQGLRRNGAYVADVLAFIGALPT